ncbi:helix-turn-helix domain-containing protein [Salipiger sp.]|uniref:helix-turn-helix domain-containing protein n=1 Tax=Salipiger sp. TaxID=2078585 RepID=UPI003A96A6E6
MDLNTVREARRRLGFTQADLAAMLNVDQGTVSRWERGLEAPRPATYSKIRDIILRHEDRRVFDRMVATVRHNLLASCLTDADVRLTEVSTDCVSHYRSKGVDIRRHLGTSLEQYAESINMVEAWKAFEESGLRAGDGLMLRLVSNVKGQGQVAHYEPLVTDGVVVGFMSSLVRTFSFAPNSEVTLEHASVLHADSTDMMTPLYCGQRSAEIQQIRYAGTRAR